jgi:membrane protein DedA with SNARE-associated domain
MEHVTDLVLHWVALYGSFALFGLLALGIIALPVPEETLMIVAGVLMANGELNLVPTVIAAYAGSICGITVSYSLGRMSDRFLLRHADRLGFTEARRNHVHAWFEKFGVWTLFIGYFVPGLRHFTGLFAGISQLEYPKFALFAYLGAIFWVSSFLAIGYFFGEYWVYFFEQIENYIELLGILAILGMVLFIYLTLRQSKTSS